MNTRYFLLLLALLGFGTLQAQHRTCAAEEIWQARAARNPSMVERRQQSEIATQNWIANHSNPDEIQAVITVPVVVHVVYNTANQNISDAQIQTQIASLNEDFRLLNADSVPTGNAFWPYTADSEIEFCLATFNPQGNATNGITRTSTSTTVFANAGLDDVKFTANGGHNNWDPTKYLNIWVCNLGNSLYGFATFPSDLAVDPNYDGVVIDYKAFGSIGTATSPADLGRTGTHEIGHWLNLSHIWGDATCGDDLVADTRVAEQENYGCPTFPNNAFSTCGTDGDGEMYMNYMDYVDDACMNMFTFGQKNRMRAALNGDRSGILSSGGCGLPAAASEALTSNTISISPNPSEGIFTLTSARFLPKHTQVVVINAMGVEVLRHDDVNAFPHTLDLSSLPSDLYIVSISNGKSVVTKKVVVAH